MNATQMPELPEGLTPSMKDVLRRLARVNRPPFHTLTPEQAKAAYTAGAGVLEIPSRPLARVEDFTIAARDGFAVAARLYAPVVSGQALPVLLYLHGGGFVVGSVATHDALCRELSHLAGCAVVSLDYRLAPQYKFPTAADDCWDALQWLSAHANTLGLDQSRLAVGGDSAGGTLATACAVAARDTGMALALQLLFYPGAGASRDTPSYRKFGQGLVLEAANVDWFFDHYLSGTDDCNDWRFAPINADVDDVAPAWIGLAEYDPMVDGALLYADKLRAAGVAVDLEIYRGVTHEFIKMGRVIPEARQAHADAAAALRQAFA